MNGGTEEGVLGEMSQGTGEGARGEMSLGIEEEDADVSFRSPSIAKFSEEKKDGGEEEAADESNLEAERVHYQSRSPRPNVQIYEGGDQDDDDSSSVADSGSRRSYSYSSYQYVACEWEEMPSFGWLPRDSISRDRSPSTRSYPESQEAVDPLSHELSTQSIQSSVDVSGDEGSKNKIGSSTYHAKKFEKGRTSSGSGSKMPLNFNFWGRRKKVELERIDESWSSKDASISDFVPRKFTYKELANATDGFHSDNKIGSGGFGNVYKGFLKDRMVRVAIKEMYSYTEYTVLNRLRHRNVVRPLGLCEERDKHFLVLEFVPNGNLFTHLDLEKKGGRCMPWTMRYKIVLELAAALLYLHEGCEDFVVHGDIRPWNIMLDSNFNVKLVDFGMSMIGGHHIHDENSTIIHGYPGYSDPEYYAWGTITKKTDVYSFGVVALEIASGRRAIIESEERKRLVFWVNELYEQGRVMEAADERLGEEFDKRQMERLIMVGLWCTRFRPSIREAIASLNFDAPEPTLPMPAAFADSPNIDVNLDAAAIRQMELEYVSELETTCNSSSTDHQDMSLNLDAAATPRTHARNLVPDGQLQLLMDANSDLAQQAEETFNVGIPIHYSEEHPSVCEAMESLNFVDSSKIDLTQTSFVDTSNIHITHRTIYSSSTGHQDMASLILDASSTSTTHARKSSNEIVQDGELQLLMDADSVLAQQAEETFDIGIPTNYMSRGPLQDHQLPFIKGLAASLHELLKSGQQFSVVMEFARKFTSMLIMVSVPLEDWNSLVQHALRSAKAIDSLKKKLNEEGVVYSTSGVNEARISSLQTEMAQHANAVEEYGVKLKNSNQQLMLAQQEQVSLMKNFTDLQERLVDLEKQIKDNEGMCLSIQEEVKCMETNRAHHLVSLEQTKRQYDISMLRESVFSRFSSFSCEK